MGVSRREFLLLSMAAMAAGCSQSSRLGGGMPGPMWPDEPDRPRPTSSAWNRPNPSYAQPEYPQTPAPGAPTAPAQPPVETLPAQPPTADIGGIQAISRTKWASAGPVMAKVNPMGTVSDITVHHEGWTPVYFSDSRTTAERLDQIRKSHLERLNAGDIGYHYIIDRAGRIWQGREVKYQGAHVKAHNEHNIGVMVLGNFDVQAPSDAQVTALRDTLVKLRKRYNVPVARIYTHQELGKTDCPGKALQPKIASLRNRGALA